MRLVLATKREVHMSERSLLFLMTAEQAEAFAGLVEAAESGDGGAACRLGDMCREELEGLRYSPKRTFHWYGRSAMAGDANGQNNLGACYEHGLGCVQSYARAVKWYRLSFAQGLGTASMNLGYCYLRGHGVPRDRAEALRLFREAVQRGEERAAQEVERLEEGPGLRGLQPAPEETAQVRPCSLASGVLPPEGPRTQLQPTQTAQLAVVTVAPQVTTPRKDETTKPRSPAPCLKPRIRFVNEVRPGWHLGLVGVTGVQPSRGGEGAADRSSSAHGPACHGDTEGEI